MKQRKRAALAAVVATMSMLGFAPAAQASCTDLGDGRCVETTICQVVTGTKPGAGLNCIE